MKGHFITEKEIIIIVLEGIVEGERRIERKSLCPGLEQLGDNIGERERDIPTAITPVITVMIKK